MTLAGTYLIAGRNPLAGINAKGGRNSLILLMAVVLMASLVTGGVPSVVYVPNNVLGNIFIAAGTSLNTLDTYLTLNVTTKCQCRGVCWSDPHCSAAAATEVSTGNVVCQLANKGPINSSLIADKLSTYYFWNVTEAGSSYVVGSDNFLYLIIRSSFNFSKAVELCASIPGHRMAILKTIAQYNAVVALNLIEPSISPRICALSAAKKKKNSRRSVQKDNELHISEGRPCGSAPQLT
nr:uncharacterized protein LOC128704023 [Cherax quadricarinatus]